MPNRKDEVVRSVSQAKSAIEQALMGLEQIPSFDPNCVRFATHSLHNYLTVTIGLAELLQDELADHPSREVRLWPKVILQAGDLMAKTIQQLTDANPLPSEHFAHNEVRFPLMVQRCCDYYKAVGQNKKIDLRLVAPTDCPLILSDHVAIGAILDNLLSNAIKYSPLDTAVDVTVRYDNQAVYCIVQDQGPGLSVEDQRRLFQRGAMLTPRPTANEPSTGYGLAVAKELSIAINGELTCESKLGQGCTFTLRLPIEPAGVEPIQTKSDGE